MGSRTVLQTALAISLVLVIAALGEASVFVGGATINGYGYAAQAEFVKSGDNLVITLSNTAAQDVMSPSEVLTALFFAASGKTLDLSPVSALLPTGSSVYGQDVLTGYDKHNHPIYTFDPTVPWTGTTDVGGEWSYVPSTGVTPPSPSPTYAVTSSGLNLQYTNTGNFNGPDLWPPVAVDGVNLGITAAEDILATGNGGIQVPLIKNTVVFTLAGFGAESVGDINQVRFQYGTALNEPWIVVTGFGQNPVPEPGTIVVWSLLFGAGWAGRRVWRRGGPVGRQP